MLNLRPSWLKLRPSWLKEKEFPEQLVDVVNELYQLPSSTHEILLLLNRVEHLLRKVCQSRYEELQKVLCSYAQAFIQDGLIKHPDNDVKVAVISCICELARITAPKLPYGDDQMKKIFKFIVFSIGALANSSSPSYNKAIDILNTFARSNLFVIMLDLECDDLVVVMFHLFLTTVTSEHPQSVFEDMQYIMSTMLEESENISFELIAPLLACMEDSDQGATKIAKELVKKVFDNCSTRLNPYVAGAKFVPTKVTPDVLFIKERCYRKDPFVLYPGAHNYVTETEPKRTVMCSDVMPTVGLQGDTKVEATHRYLRNDSAFFKDSKQSTRIYDTVDNTWKYLLCWTDPLPYSLHGKTWKYLRCWKNRLKHLADDNFLQYFVHCLNRPNPCTSLGVWKFLVHWANHPNGVNRDGVWKYLIHWKGRPRHGSHF